MPNILIAARHRHSAASQILLDPIFRVVHGGRIALFLHAMIVNVVRYDRAAHKGALVATLVIMAAITAIAPVAHSRRRRSLWFSAIDLTACAVLIAASPWILGPVYTVDFVSVTVYWAVGAPLTVAVGHHVWLGVGTGAFLGILKFIVYPSLNPMNWAAFVLYVMVSLGFGLIVEFLLDSFEERDRALAATAALGERERLNRIVHDGVLQVLALTEREGPGFGPRGVRLADLAREQESRLRALLQDRSVNLDGDLSERDLTSVLDRHSSSTVTISTMADEVIVPADLSDEIDAIVSEILTNVGKHAGPNANAWLLLEREGREAIISIRDNGVGTTNDVLTEAGKKGHVGVRDSILGRVRDLGGQAVVKAQPGRGVEWELRIPVE